MSELDAYVRAREGAAGDSPAAPLVFWDAYGLEGLRAGVGVYARRLSRALAAAGAAPPPVVGSAAAVAAWREGPAFALSAKTGAIGRLLASKPVAPLLVARAVARATARASRPVVLHGLSNINVGLWPRIASLRTVVTVHDLIPLLAPDSVSKAYFLQFRALLPLVLRRVDRVLCVSEWTRRTIVERWPDVAPKVLVVRNGVDGVVPLAAAAPPPPAGRARRLLYVARHEPYKRLELFCEIVRRATDGAVGTLVTDPPGVAWARASARDLVDEGRLEVLTGLDDEAYARAFAAVDVYVQTSRFEGFSLPAADALRAAVPVVYEAGSATDELVGRRVGVAVEPGSPVDAWRAAVAAAAGLRAAPDFPDVFRAHVAGLPTWKDAAGAVRAVYNDLTYGEPD